jgi:hypothetical protein
LHGRFVDVDRIDAGGAVQRGANGQDAGATTVVEHALAARRVCGDPAQAHARGGVRAGAKGEARVKPDHFGGGRRHFVPGGHDPETLGDRHRLELRLRQAHPVLLGHGLDLQHLAACKEVLQGQQTRGLVRIGLAAKQRHHARARPALRWRRQAGFAKQGALGIGVGIGVFDRDAQGFKRLQRVGDLLDALFRADQAQLVHTIILLAARACQTSARADFHQKQRINAADHPATFQGSGCWCRLP